MAIKKSDLYSSLWASADALRGGMDASQYKDYVLFMLFIKYVSDKYADSDDFAPPIVIPEGASFDDMVALKGKADIGERINTDVIRPLVEANAQLALNDFPDFNDPGKLGTGQEMVDRLSNLIGIFQKPELNFAKNRADHDDLLGDAYEYLMRHFATESGKSKGQFYTPAEVSRVMAQLLGIGPHNTVASTTAYDPTCGSGSLLLRVAAQAETKITLEGQEKDMTTAGLARMNMILHDFPTANIVQGNTLSAPKFRDGENLRTYDYVVANPPFSDKTWTTGLVPENDEWQRFSWGVPPERQGDYAYLLHIIRSMNSTGKAACILPHGVLFRGNAEAAIRRRLVESGILKGIVGLPANLFYGTGIPACILVLDKENTETRRGVFMIDASQGFQKDGPKNRLRERDIHRIVATFNAGEDVPRYARMVPFDEISDAKNDYNLNLPRYIDTSEPEDLHDLEAHLHGGIPERDLDDLQKYWQVLPGVRDALFEPLRPGYSSLKLPVKEVRDAILGHQEFREFNERVNERFSDWRTKAEETIAVYTQGSHPKEFIWDLAEAMLESFKSTPLVDTYAIYQHLMDYWEETMQDDAWLIAADGWIAKPERILVKDNRGRTRDRGWTCDLLPKAYVVARYFGEEQAALEAVEAELAGVAGEKTELEEEHSAEDAAFGDFEKITAAQVRDRIRELQGDAESGEELAVLEQWQELTKQESALRKQLKEQDAGLDAVAFAKYSELDEGDVRDIVVKDKWMAELATAMQDELERVAQNLTGRIRELAERYGETLPELVAEVERLSVKVVGHLERMRVPTGVKGSESQRHEAASQ